MQKVRIKEKSAIRSSQNLWLSLCFLHISLRCFVPCDHFPTSGSGVTENFTQIFDSVRVERGKKKQTDYVKVGAGKL
jgi:hypothetical protein